MKSFSQGWIRLTVSWPTGSSGEANLAFFGGKYLAHVNGTEAYFLDQESNTVGIFDLNGVTSGAMKPKRSCFVGASFTSDFAVDNKTSLIVIAKADSMVLMRPDDCQILNVVGLWPVRIGTPPTPPNGAAQSRFMHGHP